MFAFMDTPPILPEQASEFASEYDLLFWYIIGVCALGGGVVYAMLTYCCFAFAKKEGVAPKRILGSIKLEFTWTIIPLFFFLSFFIWGARLYNVAINAPVESAEREYTVVGKQWMWKVQHPSGHREINEITMEVGVPIRVTGTSEDVIHDFGIPAFRSKFDVVPGRYTGVWYKPTKVGTYHLFCDQYCGMGHSQMVGKVNVLSQEDYGAWLEGIYRTRDGKNPVDGSPAWEGRKLFLKLQCINCHNRESESRAPTLEGIYKTKRALQGGGTVLADDTYLRNSIRNPMLQVRDGWKPIMPAFTRAQVTEEELMNVISYLKSLRPGDLPSRNETSPAPVGAPTTDTSAPPAPQVPAPTPGGTR
jgi:cytochrome c oxidase subunit 2